MLGWLRAALRFEFQFMNGLLSPKYRLPKNRLSILVRYSIDLHGHSMERIGPGPNDQPNTDRKIFCSIFLGIPGFDVFHSIISSGSITPQEPHRVETPR